MDGPRNPLSIELSTANIEYLSKVCTLLVWEAPGGQQRVEQEQQVKQQRVARPAAIVAVGQETRSDFVRVSWGTEDNQ